MTGENTVVWRVRSADNAPNAGTFDALILPTDGRGKDRLGQPTRVTGATVPFESHVADVPFTLVVRARPDAGPLVVECDVLGPDGVRRVYGRSSQPLAVIVRSATGIIVAGLPEATSSPLLPPA
jgi:hypothetical protein